jgi:hypothetical protein
MKMNMVKQKGYGFPIMDPVKIGPLMGMDFPGIVEWLKTFFYYYLGQKATLSAIPIRTRN